jgi:hypothetical protein
MLIDSIKQKTKVIHQIADDSWCKKLRPALFRPPAGEYDWAPYGYTTRMRANAVVVMLL